MNAYIFIFALISKAIALEEHMDHSDVGTVLFSQSTLNNRCWTPSQIAVLRARKHFLELIPPIHVFNTQNEDFTGNMLAYFHESFAEVKKEANDIETDKVLTLALSDAIGGYLKMWVLPITKFAYYGGTVAKDDAFRLYEFQDNLMKYLRTDGKGWRNPKADFLYSMSVNIAPICQNYPRNSQFPCEDIAYFEKTKTGLAVPMPSISWEKGFECIFFPIKYQSPISLNWINASNSLMKYFNIARYCSMTSNLEDLDNFDERFQKWLDFNVIPHLNDDKLYPALRSVLSLVNKSKVFDTPDSLYLPIRNKFYIGGIPVDLSSKKMVVITVIIILEIAWCIPTLCYLMITRMKNNKSKMNFNTEQKENGNENGKGGAWQSSACTITKPAQMSSKQISASPSTQSCACLSKQKRSFDVDVETCFPQASQNTTGTATRSNFICQLQPPHIEMKDQAVYRNSARQIAPLGKSVSIKISKQSLSDKTSLRNTRPHLTPAYDSSHSKTSANSFTRYNIKKASSSFLSGTCCCKKRFSSTIKGGWCGCNRPSTSFGQNSSYTIDNSLPRNKDSFAKKVSSSLSKTGSASSLMKPTCCNCNSKTKSSSFIKTSCSDSNCDCFICIPEEDIASTSGTIITVQSLQPTETKTLLQDSVSNVNNTKISSYIQFAGSEKKKDPYLKGLKKTVTIPRLGSSQELIRNTPEQETYCNKPDNYDTLVNYNKDNSYKINTCTKLEKPSKKCVKIATLGSSQEMSRASKKPKKPPNKQMQSIAIEKASKETMIYAVTGPQTVTSTNNKDLKPSKPLLQITIDRTLPCSTPESSAKSHKPSKIPKRFFTTTVLQTKRQRRSSSKSLIPQRRKHMTVDDFGIQSKKSTESYKLNVTL